MKRWKPIFLALAVAFLLLPGVSHALTLEQQALVGLKGVFVAVANMDPQAERLGLSKAQIQTDVELGLRKAGIRVMTPKEWEGTQGIPFLSVQINTKVRQDYPIVGYSARVALTELVTLARGSQTIGEIWRMADVDVVGTQKITQIRGTVANLVEKFINDYLAANPKK